MLRGEIPGAVAVLEELRERGYRTFALGNWSREEFGWARPRFPFLDGFDDVLLSGDCGVLKPAAEIFRLASQQFGLRPEHTVFVDDRATNAEAAVALGWNGLVFEDPRQLYLVLMEYGFL
jgi:2-haloacid dehalogenase